VARSVLDLIAQTPQLPALAEAQAQFCARNPNHPDCRGDSIFGQVFEIIPAQAIQAVFPLLTLPLPGLTKSGAQQLAEYGIEDLAGAPQGTVSTAITVGQGVLSTGLISGGTMSFFDDFFTGGGVEDVFGSFNFGEFGQSLVTEVGLPLLRQELAPNPQPQFVSAGGGIMPMIRGAVGGIAGGLGMGLVGTGLALSMKEAVKAILQKIAINKNLAKVPSLSTVMTWVRKMLPVLGQAALAGTLAITAEELAQLVMAHSVKKHRRMNPANIKAIRRSMRRLDSFHRVCQKADSLRGRGRRRSSGRGCSSPGVSVVRAG